MWQARAGVCPKRSFGTSGRRPGHGQYRAFDRVADGSVGAVARPGQGVDKVGSSEIGTPGRVGCSLIDRARHPSEHLGKDHPRIPAGAHERAVAQALRQPFQVKTGPFGYRLVHLALDRLDSQGHIGPGVAVGHRVHVEAVQSRPVSRQSATVDAHNATEIICREAVSHSLRYSVSSSRRAVPGWARPGPVVGLPWPNPGRVVACPGQGTGWG